MDGTTAPDRRCDVGVWYCTYYGGDWTRVGGMSYCPTMYRPLCSDRAGDFRTYDATDTAVIDFHLRKLAEAGVDFLLFELTPGGLGGYRPSMNLFVDNARTVAKRIKIWNENNGHKLRYAVAAGAHPDVYGDSPVDLCMESEARDVFESFYQSPEYGGSDNYYTLGGKPLLVYWGDFGVMPSSWENRTVDSEFGDCFAIRYAQDVRAGSYGWNIYSGGTALHREVEVVSPGWGHYTRQIPPYVPRENGGFYRRCWETVLSNPLPKIVMIVAFNDYLENTAVWTADTERLTDADKWVGPDGSPAPSMYWDITVEYIKKLRM